MRQLFFGLLVVLLSGCVTQEEYIPLTIRNPKCSDVRELSVLKVRENYVLYWIEKIDGKQEYETQGLFQPMENHFVFLPKIAHHHYAPKQVLKIGSDQCLSYNGVFRSERDGQEQSVLIGQIIPSQIQNPDYHL